MYQIKNLITGDYTKRISLDGAKDFLLNLMKQDNSNELQEQWEVDANKRLIEKVEKYNNEKSIAQMLLMLNYNLAKVEE